MFLWYNYIRKVNETVRGYGYGRLKSGLSKPARIALATACASAPWINSKNEDTRYKIVWRSSLRIRYSPKSIQGTVARELFCAEGSGNAFYVNEDDRRRNLNCNDNDNWNSNYEFVGVVCQSHRSLSPKAGEFLFSDC